MKQELLNFLFWLVVSDLTILLRVCQLSVLVLLCLLPTMEDMRRNIRLDCLRVSYFLLGFSLLFKKPATYYSST